MYVYLYSSTESEDESKSENEVKTTESAQSQVEEGNNSLQEKPLSSALRSVLGEDPSKSSSIKLDIHSQLICHWEHYLLQGNSIEDKEKLLKKYDITLEWAAPVLNEEIAHRITEKMQLKDEYRYNIQKLLAPVLTLLGNFITQANEIDEDETDHETIEKITDAAKLVSEAMHQMSVSRRASINPRFNWLFQKILKKTLPQNFLYGNKLQKKIKKLTEAETLLRQAPGKKISNRNTGNYQRSLGAGPPLIKQNHMNSGGSPKRGFFSRRSTHRRGATHHLKRGQPHRGENKKMQEK